MKRIFLVIAWLLISLLLGVVLAQRTLAQPCGGQAGKCTESCYLGSCTASYPCAWEMCSKPSTSCSSPYPCCQQGTCVPPTIACHLSWCPCAGYC